MRQLLVVLVLGMMLLSGCTEPADPDPDDEDDGRDDTVDDNRASSEGPDPLIPGFDIAVGPGTFWEFFWMETTRTTAQGSGTSSSSEWGKTRYTLGDAMTVNGIPLHPVTRSGDTDGPIPDWTLIGYHEDRLIGSTDGYATIVLFDARAGEWTGGGFFSSATGRTGQATAGHVSTDLVDTSAYRVGFNHEEGGCTYYPNTGTICDDESHRSTASEFYKPGIGPVAYTRSATSTFSGGGYYSAHESETQVGLVETSLQDPGGWAPSGVPWTEHAPMPLPRAEPRVVEVEGKIYAFGGESAYTDYTNDLQIYDPETDSWSIGAVFPEIHGMWQPPTAAVGPFIFAVDLAPGGSSDPDYWAYYDTRSDTWTTPTALDAPVDLTAPVAVGLDRYFVLIGTTGNVGSAYAKTQVLFYDALEDEWLQGVPLEKHLWSIVPVVIGNEIFLLSGQGHYRYDILSGEWTSIGEGQHVHAAAASGQKVHAFNVGAPVKVYDPSTDAWSTGPVTVAPARGSDAAGVEGAIYLVGGAGRSDSPEPYALGEVHRYEPPE